MKYLSIFTFLIIMISSCHKEKSTTTQFNSTDFPISVGSWWKYKHIDFLGNTTDTMLLSVISSKSSGSLKEYVCIVDEYGQTVDTAILSVNDSLIKYKGFDLGYSYFGNFLLKIPFTPVSEWRNISAGDSTKVISYTEKVNVLDKFYNIFFLNGTRWVTTVLRRSATRVLRGLEFVGRTSVALLHLLLSPSRMRWRSGLNSLRLDGVNALPITGLLTFLIGVVIAYQGAEQLRKFGTNIFIVDLMGISLLREIAPLMRRS